MPYWLAKLLGRADGADVATCEQCGSHFSRGHGFPTTASTRLVCSEDCAEDATRYWAW